MKRLFEGISMKFLIKKAVIAFGSTRHGNMGNFHDEPPPPNILNLQ